MKNRFMETLGLHQARDCGDHIVFELPLVLDFNYQLLTLQIYPLDEDRGYYITDDGLAFSEMSYDAAYYIDRFEREDKNDHMGITLSGEWLFKQYPTDFSVRVAVNEFIRYFVYLDDFILRIE